MHVLAPPNCNYCERGTTSPPLYVSNTIKLQETAYAMYWPLLDVQELFFYDMPMHRKRVRLRNFMIYVGLCSPLNYKSLLIKIGFDIPWDPGRKRCQGDNPEVLESHLFLLSAFI